MYMLGITKMSLSPFTSKFSKFYFLYECLIWIGQPLVMYAPADGFQHMWIVTEGLLGLSVSLELTHLVFS